MIFMKAFLFLLAFMLMLFFVAGGQTMPWEKQPGKEKYYVWKRYLTNELKDAVNTPIADRNFLDLLASEMKNSQVGAAQIELVPGPSIDIGAYDLGSSMIITTVDLQKTSESALSTIEREIGIKHGEAMINVFHVLFMRYERVLSKDAKSPFFSLKGTTFAFVIDNKNLVAQAYDLSTSPRSTLLFNTKRAGDISQLKNIESKLNNLNADRPPKIFGGFNKIPVSDDGKYYFWKNILKYIKPTQTSLVDLAKYSIDGTLIRVEVEDRVLKPKMMDPSLLKQFKNLKLVRDPVTGIVSFIVAVENDNSNNDNNNNGDGSEFLMYGPPDGSWMCNTFCSHDECKSCCNTNFWGIMALLTGQAAACHGLSDACPWCQIGCGAAELAEIAAAYYFRDKCNDNCKKSFSDDSTIHPVCR
jgi:hypothetical protein